MLLHLLILIALFAIQGQHDSRQERHHRRERPGRLLAFAVHQASTDDKGRAPYQPPASRRIVPDDFQRGNDSSDQYRPMRSPVRSHRRQDVDMLDAERQRRSRSPGTRSPLAPNRLPRSGNELLSMALSVQGHPVDRREALQRLAAQMAGGDIMIGPSMGQRLRSQALMDSRPAVPNVHQSRLLTSNAVLPAGYTDRVVSLSARQPQLGVNQVVSSAQPLDSVISPTQLEAIAAAHGFQLSPAGAVSHNIGKKLKKKCAKWPDCPFGDACKFIHPAEMCMNWPRCQFGDACFYIHPESPCKFGLNCHNAACNYTHPEGWDASKNRARHTMHSSFFANKTLNLAPIESATENSQAPPMQSQQETQQVPNENKPEEAQISTLQQGPTQPSRAQVTLPSAQAPGVSTQQADCDIDMAS